MKDFIRHTIPEYDADERKLLGLEESWADYARGLRTGVRARIKDGTPTFRGGSLSQVSAQLGVHREDFDTGTQTALIDALRLACDENVPLPYWLADGIRAALDGLHADPEASLHTVFGMDKRYATTAKRSAKDRLDLATKDALYKRATMLMAEGIGKGEAIRRATKGLPVEFRKAFDWFNETDRRQQRHLAAWQGRKLHKFR